MFRRLLPLVVVPVAGLYKNTPVMMEGKSVEQFDFTNIAVIPGNASKKLTKDICAIMGLEPALISISTLADGETEIELLESIRGKDVFFVQTCAAPVNDNIMELLLSISAAKRAGAQSLTAVIPYFGYKYNHRRGLPISTTHSSRFLWSAAGDLAKMLQVMGVDKVISVDLQRPGQGHEACFFDSVIPVETISSIDAFTTYIKDNIVLTKKVVIVSPNTEYVKKARKFQKKLQAIPGMKAVGYASFLHEASDSSKSAASFNRYSLSELLGDVKDADVFIVDDIVDTAGTLSTLCKILKKEGADRIFVCASHGLFSNNSMQLIDLSPVEMVIVTDSVPLPRKGKISDKIVQVPLAKLLAHLMESEAASKAHKKIIETPVDDETFELD